MKLKARGYRVKDHRVAPLAGAWIETAYTGLSHGRPRSHPSRVRGLKHYKEMPLIKDQVVAPLAGAWIETGVATPANQNIVVAPLAGAWIET